MSLDSLRSKVAQIVVRAEGWWFDWSRGVTISKPALLSDLTLAGSANDGFMYLPARVRSIRRALRDVKVANWSRYTFIDLGSGKGRALFVAAEKPFHRLIGVEFAAELQVQAAMNVKRQRGFRRRCRKIALVQADIQDFEFPNEDLVIFLFNPFPAHVLVRVISSLGSSLKN